MSDQEIEKRFKRLERIALMAAKSVFTVEEAALYINRSQSYVYHNLPLIPHYRSDDKEQRIWFKRTELDEWLCTVHYAGMDEILRRYV